MAHLLCLVEAFGSIEPNQGAPLEDDISDSDSEIDVDSIVTSQRPSRTLTPLSDGNTTDASRQAASSQLSASSVSICLDLDEPASLHPTPARDSVIIIDDEPSPTTHSVEEQQVSAMSN